MSILKPSSSLTEIYSKLTTCGKSDMRPLLQKEPSKIFWKYILDTITSASTKGLIKRKYTKEEGGAEKRPGVGWWWGVK